MFPNRLSEVTPVDIQALISTAVSEGTDVEFKRELPSKLSPDPWMSGGKIGNEAKDQLAEEIIGSGTAECEDNRYESGECRIRFPAVGFCRA
jgi:hypothetical protein